MPATLVTQIDSSMAILTLNRPEKHNALNEELVRTMIEQLQQINQDSSIRVVLLQAKGKDFCAGADLSWLMQEPKAGILLAELMQSLQQLDKPTIALVQGNSYGGALGLIACCDIAISTPRANFCFSEVKLGLIPAVIAPYCIAAMGQRAAQYYFLTAQAFHAEEAQRLGLIHQVVSEQDLLESGRALAETLLANSPQAMSAVKRLLNTYCWPDSNSLIEDRLRQLTAQQNSSDAQEGFKAFLEKRQPNWAFVKNDCKP